MHELAVCQALMDQVGQIAASRHAGRVVSIHVGIGPLSGVEAALLEQAFPIASAGSCAANAELFVTSLPVTVHCSSCGSESPALPARLVCGQCGDWRTTLVSGDELQLTRLEFDAAGENRENTDV